MVLRKYLFVFAIYSSEYRKKLTQTEKKTNTKFK